MRGVKRVITVRGADHIIEVGGTLTMQALFCAIGFNGLIYMIAHVTNPFRAEGTMNVFGAQCIQEKSI